MNEMNVTVTIERGEERCICCGAYIRNIVRIDGIPYGTKCALAFMPRNTEIKAIARNFEIALANQAVAEKNALRSALIAFAYDNFPKALHNQTNEWYQAYIQERPNSRFVLNMYAIFAARAL